jgi:NAD+ kinase
MAEYTVDWSQLGGDGTVLFTSWLFQHVVPPVIPFALGSLGFLTCFDFSDYKAVLETAINDGVRVNLRMRFTATIYRAVPESEQNELGNVRSRVVRSAQTGAFMLETATNGEWENRENCGGGNTSTTGGDANANVASGGVPNAGKDKVVRCSITRPVESFEVLNDLVVDRGPSPYVSLLELFGEYTACWSIATVRA